MFVKRSPRTQIVPSKAGRDAVDTRLTFALGRARLQHSVIDADVLAPGIEPGKRLLEAARAVAGSNLIQQRRGLRQMLAERIGQGLRAPDEHSAVPEKIACLYELLCDLGGRFLGEAADLEHSPG